MKTAFDKFSSVTGLLVVSPILAVVSLVNVFHFNNKNPFYTVKRMGQDGQPFDMLKFRSMDDIEGASDEKRTTKWGKLLRATAIDELPQLINIAKGDMSFVGPRPREYRDWPGPIKEEEGRIFSVKPGLTGLWQVGVIGAKEKHSYEERNELDAKYVMERGSLLRDLAILVKTIPAFVKGHDGEYIDYKSRRSAEDKKDNDLQAPGNDLD